LRSGSSSQIAVGKAGCLIVSATVGTLGGGALGAILYEVMSLVVGTDYGGRFRLLSDEVMLVMKDVDG
jgi:hypothetical protein